jgi:hypothetical protein
VTDFKESFGKIVVRKRILEEARKLRGDGMFSYFGLPGPRCLDLCEWESNIKIAYCCEFGKDDFETMRRTVVRVLGARAICVNANIWEFMNKNISNFVDLCNLDFCGGPSSSRIPEISELQSLSRFMSFQRGKENSPFLIAWTFGVRNVNYDFYKTATINYIKEIYPQGLFDFPRFEKWLSQNKRKMIRSYLYFVPFVTFECAKSNRYNVELIEAKVYKKIMYFCLLKLIPSERQISAEQKHAFFSKIVERPYLIYDDNNKLSAIEQLPINEFLAPNNNQ